MTSGQGTSIRPWQAFLGAVLAHSAWAPPAHGGASRAECEELGAQISSIQQNHGHPVLAAFAGADAAKHLRCLESAFADQPVVFAIAPSAGHPETELARLLRTGALRCGVRLTGDKGVDPALSVHGDCEPWEEPQPTPPPEPVEVQPSAAARKSTAKKKKKKKPRDADYDFTLLPVQVDIGFKEDAPAPIGMGFEFRVGDAAGLGGGLSLINADKVMLFSMYFGARGYFAGDFDRGAFVEGVLGFEMLTVSYSSWGQKLFPLGANIGVKYTLDPPVVLEAAGGAIVSFIVDEEPQFGVGLRLGIGWSI